MITGIQKLSGGVAATVILLTGLGMAIMAKAQTSGDSSTAAPQFQNLAPRIIATSPKVGARDVDPALKEITVTFDRDMSGDMSWTGGGPDFPKSTKGAKAHWRNNRTCVLPVKLESGHHYRVGINSMSHHGFHGANGMPAAISAITFTTSGQRVMPKTPEIVSFDPPNGARDVNPETAELQITFNVQMGGGFTWAGGGPNFPTIPDGKKPYWKDDGKTCVLPVALKPGWQYELGLNSRSYHGFQSAEEVPA